MNISLHCVARTCGIGLVAGMAGLLLACNSGGGGGGGGGGSSTLTGQFKDSNVSGVAYRTSRGAEGVTGSQGEFDYRRGDTVTFSIGRVEVGTAEADTVVTPLDFVPFANTSNDEVLNRVRFLMVLDEDQDPGNGISVPDGIVESAAFWDQPDFDSTVQFEADMDAILLDVEAQYGPVTLPTTAAARSHLEETLLCVRSGAYRGTYRGGDSGTFGVLINALSGNVTVIASQSASGDVAELVGVVPVAFNQNGGFESRNAGLQLTFAGSFGSVNSLQGVWENGAMMQSGTFSGNRIGGAANAAYRFTGSFGGGDSGLFSFDVTPSGSITGVAYSLSEDELYPLTGSVTDGMLSASFASGTGQISGSLNLSTGALSGTWENTVEGAFGSFSGSGCRLN